jgi:hypothetical protein
VWFIFAAVYDDGFGEHEKKRQCLAGSVEVLSATKARPVTLIVPRSS